MKKIIAVFQAQDFRDLFGLSPETEVEMSLVFAQGNVTVRLDAEYSGDAVLVKFREGNLPPEYETEEGHDILITRVHQLRERICRLKNQATRNGGEVQ